MTSSGPAAVPASRPRDHREPRLYIAPQAAVTPPPAGQPGHGSEAILRNQPVRIVHGRFEGGYTDVYEIVCPDCGDHPDLDYSEVSWRLQWLRGPHPLEAGLTAYHLHLGLDWPTRAGLKLPGRSERPGRVADGRHGH